jgi:DNA-binding transcriptional ArsR family regulator
MEKNNLLINNREIYLDLFVIKKIETKIRIIRNPVSVRIIRLLEKREKDNLTVTEIYSELKLVQSEVSLHLAKLRSINLVKTSKVSRYVYYTLNYEQLNEFQKVINDFLKLVNH